MLEVGEYPGRRGGGGGRAGGRKGSFWLSEGMISLGGFLFQFVKAVSRKQIRWRSVLAIQLEIACDEPINQSMSSRF